MLSNRNASILVSLVVSGVLAVGCGSAKDSTFEDGTGEGQLAGSEGFDGNGNGAQPVNGSSGGTTGAGAVGNVDPSSACASSNAGAALEPVSLVFMIDRSGSMASDNNTNTRPVRWDPVVAGLTTFFGDARSSNVEASLAFYSIQKTVTSKACSKSSDCNRGESCVNKVCTDIVSECSSASYAQPVVAMTQLPNASPFQAAFSATGPSGGTPTAPALEGAIASARTVKAAGKNVAVVLATDGEPNDCSSSVSAVENVAAAGLADGIKTYVIGVGPSTGNLNSFAQKGGSNAAIMIPTNDAAQVSADLIKAVNQIASSLLGCSYALPAPPSGQTLDVNAVNVNFTPQGGAAKTLPYSADCANVDGWHYDDAKTPTQVILCGGSCTTAQASVGAKLDIIFGCATAVPSGGVDPNGNVR
jgi:hypothetical protein